MLGKCEATYVTNTHEMSIKPVRAARITDTAGALLGESPGRRKPRNTVKHDVFEHPVQVLCTVVVGWGAAGWTLGIPVAIWPTKDNARGSATVCEGLAWQLRADQVRLAVMQPRC